MAFPSFHLLKKHRFYLFILKVFPTDGQTDPVIEIQGRIKKFKMNHFKRIKNGENSPECLRIAHCCTKHLIDLEVVAVLLVVAAAQKTKNLLKSLTY